MKDYKKINKCPDCGVDLQFGSGCHFCPACGWGKCGRMVETVAGFVVMLLALAVVVFA